MSRHLPTGSNSGRSQQLLQKLNAANTFAPGVEWLSPVQQDDFAEYRDEDFLKRLRIDSIIEFPLKKFWPTKGPQWDGLGRKGDQLILVEAKAYIEEYNSPECGAGPESLKIIRNALKETQRFMKVRTKVDWCQSFYQVTNRLAHLYYLNVLNRIPSQLWMIYSCDHKDPLLATSKEQWSGAKRLVEAHLGIRGKKLMDRVRHIFINATTLQEI